ncbi:class I SAM-dependent methyltransferase [Salisediminibacterium beveridgei]|uniref:SAM-dependent methyltransferase n=1 Tax=Salisediminibacterium beveridgei TaxID=632773 RepID=A0A1D7QXG6_9BACI|nr:methyltransferase domain-containing protein [Salisediminibacterium beveridgei]AOM83700.1 SAM-dependent methyltransferase [Salisediminibacterium beveridgei]
MAGDRFDPNEAARLLDPERKKLVDADWVAEKLGIEGKMNVIDLGAGNGYFTLPIAARTKGDVYAVDVEPEMLGMLSARVEEAGFEHVGYIQSDLEDVSLGDNVAERAVIAFVIHEVGDRVKAFKEMKRMLTKGGRGAVVEWARVDNPHAGPPQHERLAPDDVTADMKKAGLAVDEVVHHSEVYTIFFHIPV